MKELDQPIITDLIINIQEHVQDKQLEGDKYLMELFIKESFEKVKALFISGFINYSRIYDPNNS